MHVANVQSLRREMESKSNLTEDDLNALHRKCERLGRQIYSARKGGEVVSLLEGIVNVLGRLGEMDDSCDRYAALGRQLFLQAMQRLQKGREERRFASCFDDEEDAFESNLDVVPVM